uniref:DDE_Tnp_Tn3 domain-containing protein n=1 Tax=Caenorhabditis tropicalis TaxID=1561998 RepID=A0A1I7TL62_9PELO
MANKEFYFAIIGHCDQPIFEMDFPAGEKKTKESEGTRHLNHYIGHAALDIVDEHALTTSQMYLKGTLTERSSPPGEEPLQASRLGWIHLQD